MATSFVDDRVARAQTAPPTPQAPADSAAPVPEPPPGEPPPLAPMPAPLVPQMQSAPQPATEPPPGKPGKTKKRKSDGGDDVVPAEHVAASWGAFDVKGRIFARADLSQRDVLVFDTGGVLVPSTAESLDLSVPSARVSLRYRAPVEWLSAEIEVDVSGKPDMKDGYINARGKNLSARVGQFKLPSSAIELESPWTLPLIRRGFISDVIVDRMDIAGRRPGLMFGWRAKGLLKPRVSIGAFQGAVVTEEGQGIRKMDLLVEQTLESQSLAARAQIELGPVQVGGYYQHRVGSPAAFRTAHYWTAGGDVTLDWILGSGGLRVWLDGMAGASWYESRDKPVDQQNATFVSGRALVAYRLGGIENDAPYFEIFGLGAFLDPDVDVTTDIAWEAVVGVNAGLWNRARLSLQGEMIDDQRNFPYSYFLGMDPSRRGILAQAGITF